MSRRSSAVSIASAGVLVACGILLSWKATIGVVVGSGIAVTALLAPVFAFMLLVGLRSSLDRLGEVGLALGPVTLNLAGGVALLLVGVAVWTMLTMRVGYRGLGRAGVGFAILPVLAAWGCVVGSLTLGSAGVMLGLKETLRYGSILAVFFLAFTWSDTSWRRQRLVRIAFLTLLIPCAVAAVQGFSGSSPYEIVNETLVRVGGTFVHPNAFALYVVVFLLVALSLWMNRAPLLPRSIMLIIVVGLLVLLILSYSRSRWIAALVGLIVIPNMRRHAWRWALIVLVVAVPFSDRVATRFSDIALSLDLLRTVGAREVTLGRGESQSSFEWRLLNALVLTRVGMESPWVGHGARTTEQVTPLRLLDDEGKLAGYASHNDVVETFVEYGLLGLLAVLAAIGLIWTGIRAAMGSLSPASPERALGTGLLSAGTALVVAGVTGGHVLVATAALYGFGLLAGVVVRAGVEAEE